MTATDRARTLSLTACALIAFAANSVLARLALRAGTVDAASFTAIRLASGAAVLVLLVASRRSPGGGGEHAASGAAQEQKVASALGGSWMGALALFGYAAPFSFAYLRLTTATGALILFGFVQVTMITWALVSGERPSVLQWCGLITALAGLVYLMLPGLEAPPLGAGLLMGTAGVSWGVYSLLGRSAPDPLSKTAGNFVRSVPMVLLLVVFSLTRLQLDAAGVLLALASGALASGVGYAVWYAALGGLTSTNAAIVQLAVPVLAAAAGVVLLAETITLRLAIASLLVLGGIAMAIAGRAREGGRAGH